MLRCGQKGTLKFKVNWGLSSDLHETPKFGEVYTIRDFFEGVANNRFEILMGVHLNEIRNPPCRYIDGFYEPGWYIGYFRPVIDLEFFNIQTEKKPVLENA